MTSAQNAMEWKNTTKPTSSEWDAKILAFGSRSYENLGLIKSKLEEVQLTYFYEENIRLIHGAAPGADTLAARAAHELGWEVNGEPAKWTEHVDCYCFNKAARICKGAGPRRNQRMLDVYEPDIAVGFIHGKLADSSGSLDMATRAISSGIMVVMFGEG